MNKCFFFDRDGIINKRKIGGYIKDYEAEFEFISEIFDVLNLVNENDFLKIIVTNQQGIGKGLMTEQDLSKVHNKMQYNLFKELGFGFDDIYYSPDLANSGSRTRKPEPGMILEAIKKWDIDVEKSFLLGDSESDAIAGERAGLRTILIGEFEENKANFVFSSFRELKENLLKIVSS